MSAARKRFGRVRGAHGILSGNHGPLARAGPALRQCMCDPIAATRRCVFRNPAPGVSAGKLIDVSGLKGTPVVLFTFTPRMI